jgi:hypothetical protein
MRSGGSVALDLEIRSSASETAYFITATTKSDNHFANKKYIASMMSTI